MKLRRANCGHYIPADAQAVGEDVEHEPYLIYLCADCKEKALGQHQHNAEPVLTKKA